MTMDVKANQRLMRVTPQMAFFQQSHQKGQSMLEFAFLLPIIIFILQILIQVESAISTAIVNQQYARSTLHYLMFNHRFYPELHFLPMNSGLLMGRFWVGVDDHVVGDELDSDSPSTGSTNIVPHAPERKIGRYPGHDDGTANAEYTQDFPITRQKIRIRITAFTCVPPVGSNDGHYLSEGNMRENTFRSGNYTYCLP